VPDQDAKLKEFLAEMPETCSLCGALPATVFVRDENGEMRAYCRECAPASGMRQTKQQT
jgi:hypothetical protein